MYLLLLSYLLLLHYKQGLFCIVLDMHNTCLAPPKVINTADIPKLRKYVAVSFISLSLLIEIPVNNSASVSFGIIISVNSKSDLGNSIAGAGFNTVVIFCLQQF